MIFDFSSPIGFMMTIWAYSLILDDYFVMNDTAITVSIEEDKFRCTLEETLTTDNGTFLKAYTCDSNVVVLYHNPDAPEPSDTVAYLLTEEKWERIKRYIGESHKVSASRRVRHSNRSVGEMIIGVAILIMIALTAFLL